MYREDTINGTLLLTIENVIQVGDDLLILPHLPAEKHDLVGFNLDNAQFGFRFDKIQLLKPDGQAAEMKVEVSISFARPPTYFILIPNAKEAQVPLGSQIWIV